MVILWFSLLDVLCLTNVGCGNGVEQVPELEQFQLKLTRLYWAMREQYCQRCAPGWLRKV